MVFVLLVSILFLANCFELSCKILIYLSFFMYTDNNLDNRTKEIDIDVAGKATYKLSNFTSLPSFL